MKETNDSLKLKEFCINEGAELVAIADLKPLKEGLPVYPADILEPYSRAISIALPLDMKAVSEMNGEPTAEFAANCNAISARLNILTEKIAAYIQEKGYRAEAIPASKKNVEGGTLGSVSHKAVAVTAGLGWQGKSLLLVTPKYGPRIRLSTVLTDMPLAYDRPIKNRCGSCTNCTEACPAGAIKNVNTEFHYLDRNEAIDLDKCHNNTKKYLDKPGVGYTFCGQCIPVCPHGSKYMKEHAG